MTESVEKEIIKLYFDKVYSYSEIMKYFNGKYSYAEIKKTINDYYKKFENR